MIDPQYLKHGDTFVFSVVRNAGQLPVVTMNMRRGGRLLLRSPDIVPVRWEAHTEAELPQDALIAMTIPDALPQQNKLPPFLEIYPVRAECADGTPIPHDRTTNFLPGDMLGQLGATLHRSGPQCQIHAPFNLWDGITLVEFRVVDTRRPPDHVDEVVPAVPPLNLPPVGSAAAALKKRP